MSEKYVEINPLDYHITPQDIENVSKAGVVAVHLISFTPEYFSQKPQGEVMQSISITETGKVKFNSYLPGEKFGALKNGRQQQTEIGVLNSSYIFHFILKLLEKDNYKKLDPRPGCWQAAIDYTNGERRNFYGPFYNETLISGIDVNDFIIKLTKIANPSLFGHVDALAQLEQCLENFSNVTTEANLQYVYQALQYCIYKKVAVDTMVKASGLDLAGEKASITGGFGIEPLTLEDGEHALVAMTSEERRNAFPAPYFVMELEALMRYTLNQEVLGLFLNPGTHNFLLPKEIIQAVLDSFDIKN